MRKICPPTARNGASTRLWYTETMSGKKQGKTQQRSGIVQLVTATATTEVESAAPSLAEFERLAASLSTFVAGEARIASLNTMSTSAQPRSGLSLRRDEASTMPAAPTLKLDTSSARAPKSQPATDAAAESRPKRGRAAKPRQP